MLKPLAREFYKRHPLKVARDLLGMKLVRIINAKKLVGEIVEAEAYGGRDDPASHAYHGLTERNKSMFSLAGIAYIYFIYGNHYCLNVVAKRGKEAGAVLIRALKPVEGINIMVKNRGVFDVKKLTSGPGKLTKAFGIDKRFDGWDLTLGSELYIAEGKEVKDEMVEYTSRIGVKAAKRRKWRVFVKNSVYVSRT
jgi:DNA-3-methyladenine glycosylase